MARKTKHKYISTMKTNTGTYYQLRLPTSTKPRKYVYITGSKNLQELLSLRDKIMTQPHTQQELQQLQQQYRKKAEYKKAMITPHIRHTSNKKRYQIYHKKKTYGCYDTLEEAEQVRDKLVANNWDEQKCGLNITRKKRNPENRYIYKDRDKYIVRRLYPSADGIRSVLYDSGFRSLEEARVARDWWESVDWDWDMIDNI